MGHVVAEIGEVVADADAEVARQLAVRADQETLAAAAVAHTLNAAFLSPFTLATFEKLDGRSLETQGRKVYEMRIRAVVKYQGISLRCRRKSCPELHHYIMDVDTAAKTATDAQKLGHQ